MGSLDIEKMMALISALYLITASGALTTLTPGTVNNVTVGEHVLFPFDHQNSAQYEVIFERESPITYKIASWEFIRSDVRKSIHPLYEERVEMDSNSSVMLRTIQKNDSGDYNIEINHFMSTLKGSDKKSFALHVFEMVSQPVVVTDGNCSTQNITLSCSVPIETSVVFHWEKQSLSRAAKDMYNGRILVIDHNMKEEQYVYVCIVENPVSKATSEEVKIRLCNLFNFKDQIQLWMFSIIGASIFLLILILIICCFKTSRKASCNELTNEAKQENNEETAIYEHELIEPTYTTRIETRTF
eukprot:gi/632934619/ref/XP_007885660.1/ PREDICTED: hepatocyte cell adhesion molecule-like isoform X2 [Callorhinchus milii]